MWWVMWSTRGLHSEKPDQWRIQDFPGVGASNSQSGCANLLFCRFCAENCIKMKEFGHHGRGGASLAPLGSANDEGSFKLALQKLLINPWEIRTFLLLFQILIIYFSYFGVKFTKRRRFDISCQANAEQNVNQWEVYFFEQIWHQAFWLGLI